MTVRVWFPRLFLECHREQAHSDSLAAALAAEGVECVGGDDPEDAAGCDLIFCGSFSLYSHVMLAREKFPGLPVVHYNWDIYPFQVNDHGPDGRLTVNGTRWREYLGELRGAAEVWVPSQCTVTRTVEFAGRGAVVIKSPVYPWEPPETRPRDVPRHLVPGGYVVDVMRKYPGDPNADATREVCEDLGIPCVEMRHTFGWDAFRWTVANAGLLVSANHEASTGGLTLLEGYCHGVPVLISDSPRHGGVDYFGPKACYFCWDDRGDLRGMVKSLMGRPKKLILSAEECRHWVCREYSDAAFARQAAARFKRLAGV